jgi:hypothetical protein
MKQKYLNKQQIESKRRKYHMKHKLIVIIITLLMTLTILQNIPNDFIGQSSNPDENNSLPAHYTLIERNATWNKYYNTSTGEYALELYTDEINYQDANHTWNPIDTTIIRIDQAVDGQSYTYGMNRSRYQIYFTENSTDTNTLYSIINSSQILAIIPTNSLEYSDGTFVHNKQSTTGVIANNSIIYPDLYGEGIHLMLSCQTSRIRSLYLISNISILPPPENENCTLDFTETLHLNTTEPESENHSLGITYGPNQTLFKNYGVWENQTVTTPDTITFRDHQNMVVFSIPRLYAWDNSSQDSTILLDKTLQMTTSGDLWIQIHVPYIWLSNPNRILPVSIDPSITIYGITTDGYLDKLNANYTAAWESLTGTIRDTYDYLTIGQRVSSPPLALYTIDRGFLFFNTSTIHDNASITSVSVSLYGKNKQITSQEFNLIIQNGQPTNPHVPLQTTDYDQRNYSDDGGSLNTSDFITTGYNTITLNTQGQSWVNLTGTTKLCLRSNRDINQNPPTKTDPNEYIEIYSAEKGTGYKPKCIITYMLPLSITINFAGNLSDKGGPYWQPPGENIQLDGVWSDGYYTNDSRQQEDWIFINLSVLHPTGASNQYTASNVSHVWLQWLNDTIWTNWSYEFKQAGNYWEYNTSGFISTQEGYDYSFNIVANDTANNSYCRWWNKTGIGGRYTRRFVQLGCDPIDISYTPLYLFNYTSGTGNPPTYGLSDSATRDRLHHDQGPDGSLNDSGYLSYYDQNLNDTMHLRYCGGFVGYFFEDSKCIESFELKNIYYHFWSASSNGDIRIFWNKTKGCPLGNTGFDIIDFHYITDSRSEIYWNNNLANFSNNYYLCTAFKNITAQIRNFTDNDINEYVFEAQATGQCPSIICNRSISSFLLINLPDNVTLDITNSDNDNLSDLEELYKYYTNPFLSDTDNDGFNDDFEIENDTDPNDYTDY